MSDFVYKTARLVHHDLFTFLGALAPSSFVAATVISTPDRVTEALTYEPFNAEILRLLVPGGHIIASNDTRRHHVAAYRLERAGFEMRAIIARLVDNGVPVGADFANGWEPWILLRKPLVERTVADNLRRHAAGALRRLSQRSPMVDLVDTRATGRSAAEENDERAYLRLVARTVTPVKSGVILEPLASTGAFAAACVAEGVHVVSVFGERAQYEAASKALSADEVAS